MSCVTGKSTRLSTWRRLFAVALGAAAVVVLQPHFAYASTTATPNYDDSFGRTWPTYATTDPTTLSSASAAADQKPTGQVSVETSAKSNAVPFGYGYSSFPYVDLNSPQANATALVSVTEPVGITAGTGSVTVDLSNISVTTSGAGAGSGTGGGYVRDYAVAYHYPCSFSSSPPANCSPDAFPTASHDLDIVFYDGSTAVPSAGTSDILTIQGVPAGGTVIVEAGLDAAASAQGGSAQFTANGSATVASIAIP